MNKPCLHLTIASTLRFLPSNTISSYIDDENFPIWKAQWEKHRVAVNNEVKRKLVAWPTHDGEPLTIDIGKTASVWRCQKCIDSRVNILLALQEGLKTSRSPIVEESPIGDLLV